MDPITPLTPTAPGAAADVAPAAGSKDKTAKHSPSPKENLSVEQLLARVNQLEVENKKANERAEGFLQQFENLKARGALPVELKTTTTKPTLTFEVSSAMGVEKYEVVDESEAKRLYCAAKQIDPSAAVLKVRCLDQEKRNGLIFSQYENAGIVPERIPGVDPKFVADKRRAKAPAAV